MNPERGPEAGFPAVDGIAIGRAVIWAGDPEPRNVSGTADEEHGRLARALRLAARDVDDLVRLLPPAEAELFLPEVAILAELGPLLPVRVVGIVAASDGVAQSGGEYTSHAVILARGRNIRSPSCPQA
jgi:hypothetical protein